MRAIVKIVSVGFIWGWLQASALLLALLFFASHSRQVYDFGLSWEIGLLAALLSSFVAGFVLSDLESVLKALLLSTFVAFAYSMLVVSILAVPVSVSREQGYAEAVFLDPQQATQLSPAWSIPRRFVLHNLAVSISRYVSSSSIQPSISPTRAVV